MDIYNFINSKDIAAHCRNINHQFNAMEAAFIVYFNHSITLQEKHNAYHEIIETMPDMEITKRMNCPYYKSLHGFLKEFMAIENKLLNDFKEDTDKAVYQYGVYYPNGIHGGLNEEQTIFSALTAALAAIKAQNDKFDENEDNPDDKIQECKITKRWLDTEKYIEVITTPDGEPLRCDANYLNDKDFYICNSFEGMWIEIPTPFKKGDILIWTPPPSVASHGYYRNPFVLTGICCWDISEKRRRTADASDMIAWGHLIDEDGNVFNECMHNYQDLEYYRGELYGVQRILTALSNYEKDEIGIVLLMRAYEIIRNEHHFKNSGNMMWYTDEGMRLAGLLKENMV